MECIRFAFSTLTCFLSELFRITSKLRLENLNGLTRSNDWWYCVVDMVSFMKVEKLMTMVHIPSPNFNLKLCPYSFELSVGFVVNVG